MRASRLLHVAKAWNASRNTNHGYVTRLELQHHRRYVTAANRELDATKTRNIGIIAHIDAGKTTTTERMLYYSGYTRRIGNVDEGSTVTDFLPAERARGITIQSAAISFSWPPLSSLESPEGKVNQEPWQFNVNLIDTPGHADFTFEVIRSLRVLDGAVCILDGVAGVEAQTEKVWMQASNFSIPRIIYVNKLDREGAAFNKTIREIAARLHAWPAVCSIPWWQAEDGKLCGVADAVHLQGLLWKSASDGKEYQRIPLTELDRRDPRMARELIAARTALIELLSEHDDNMVESFLMHGENHLTIPPEVILTSLRKCTLQQPQTLFPVFAGASFRNLGVQPLLDAVTQLLPSPAERADPPVRLAGQLSALGDIAGLITNGSRATSPKSKKHKGPKVISYNSAQIAAKLTSCALAFKVVNDLKRGVLVYVRVYSGRLDRNSLLYNTNLKQVERVPRLLKMYANDGAEVPYIGAGQIGVIPGLKYARTGDTLVTYDGMNAKIGPPAPISSLQLNPIDVPPPVFWVSVEASSLSEEKNIENSLQILLREDPSLNVTYDPESGQRHLAGMGELHLEIARDRLLQDFKARAHVGRVEISYREAVQTSSTPQAIIVEREFGGKIARASCVITLSPTTSAMSPHRDTSPAVSTIIDLPDDCQLTIAGLVPAKDGEPEGNPSEGSDDSLPMLETVVIGIQNGAAAGLARGPEFGYPLHSTNISVDVTDLGTDLSEASPTAFAAAVREGIQQALSELHSVKRIVLMEPVMLATITVNEADMGGVMQDLTSVRGAQILSLDSDTDGDSPGLAAGSGQLHIDSRRVYAPKDPFSAGDGNEGGLTQFSGARQFKARVPLREMVGYLRHLRSLTGGRGTFIMQVDRFDKVVGNRLKSILAEMRGTP